MNSSFWLKASKKQNKKEANKPNFTNPNQHLWREEGHLQERTVDTRQVRWFFVLVEGGQDIGKIMRNKLGDGLWHCGFGIIRGYKCGV